MPEIHHVIATLRQPAGARDPGQVTSGYYTLADDNLTMTDGTWSPVRDHKMGERIMYKLTAEARFQQHPRWQRPSGDPIANPLANLDVD